MSTVATWQIDSSSSEDTSGLGERLGLNCKGGEVFLLSSDLGGGKTTFAQGLARGLGASEHVGSPTYTISRVYPCKNGLYLHHFDFYRLHEAGVVAHELSEVIDDPHAIVAIEWGDVVSDVLPARAVTLTLNRVPAADTHRHITISCPAGSLYVLNGLK